LIYKRPPVNIGTYSKMSFTGRTMKLLNAHNVVLILASMFLLFGCYPYKVDVQQGNIIDKKNLSQLHPGISKSEVKALLGTPVLADPFDTDVWLYAYTKQINGGKIDKKKLILKFRNDKLILLQ
jgi:outer membrane protein assembly factor BamE (lipoprotein component of BamABCDE complex)